MNRSFKCIALELFERCFFKFTLFLAKSQLDLVEIFSYFCYNIAILC